MSAIEDDEYLADVRYLLRDSTVITNAGGIVDFHGELGPIVGEGQRGG